MEKKHSMAAFGLFIALFMFLLGCTLPPIKTKTIEYTYVFKKDGSVWLEAIESGKLPAEGEQAGIASYGSVEDWSNDCTKELSKTLKEGKNYLLIATHGQDLNEDQKRQMEALIKAVNELLEKAKCKFTANKDDNTAVYTITFELSRETLQALVEMKTQVGGINVSFIPMITESGSRLHVNIPLKNDTNEQESVQVKKIKIKAEGEIANLSPENYTKEGDYYVFSDVEKLKGSEISFDYKPSLTAPETSPTATETPTESPTAVTPKTESTEQTPEKSASSKEKFSLFGVEIPISPELMLYGLVAIIALIVLIIIAAFIRSRQREEKKSDAKSGISGQKPGQALIRESQVVDLKKSVRSGAKPELSSESDIVVETRKEPVEKARLAIREEPKARPTASKLSEADMKIVERTTAALAPKKGKYTPEQLRKVMLDMGYKEEVANEIIKRLYE